VVKAPKFCHVTPILKFLHWLKIDERIEYNGLSLTHKAFTTAQLLAAQPDLCSAPRVRATRSIVTLSRPPTYSSLRITNRSFRYASPHLWNQLPVSFRQPCTKHRPDVTLTNSPPTCSPLSPSITHSLFHSKVKTHVFHKSFPPLSASTHLNCLLGIYWTGLTRLNAFSFLVIFYFILFIYILVVQ